MDTGWPYGFDLTTGLNNLPAVSAFVELGSIPAGIGNITENPADETGYEQVITPLLRWFPGGNQAEKSYRGVKALIKGYSESDKGDVRFPIDRSWDDFIMAPLFGERATGEGKEYAASGGRPLSESQNEQFLGQEAGGLSTTEAYKNVTGTGEATRTMNDASKLKKQGDTAGSKEAAKKAAALREGITLPADTPEWGVSRYTNQDPVMLKVSEAWRESGNLNVLPKSTPNYIERGGKQLLLDTPELVAAFEAEYEKNYMVALKTLFDKRPNASPDEIADEASYASTKTRKLFISWNWKPKN